MNFVEAAMLWDVSIDLHFDYAPLSCKFCRKIFYYKIEKYIIENYSKGTLSV